MDQVKNVQKEYSLSPRNDEREHGRQADSRCLIGQRRGKKGEEEAAFKPCLLYSNPQSQEEDEALAVLAKRGLWQALLVAWETRKAAIVRVSFST